MIGIRVRRYQRKNFLSRDKKISDGFAHLKGHVRPHRWHACSSCSPCWFGWDSNLISNQTSLKTWFPFQLANQMKEPWEADWRYQASCSRSRISQFLDLIGQWKVEGTGGGSPGEKEAGVEGAESGRNRGKSYNIVQYFAIKEAQRGGSQQK